MKRNRSFAFSLWPIDPGGAHYHKWIFRISIQWLEEILFMLYSVYSTVQQGKLMRMQSLLAYEIFVN